MEAWGLAHSRLSASIEEAQMRVSAETDGAGNPNAMWPRVGNYFAVGRLGLQGFIGPAARREQQ